jgi:hypothetical protein
MHTSPLRVLSTIPPRSNALISLRAPVDDPSSLRTDVAFAALLSAFELLAQRGDGNEPWALPFRDNVLAFLLDSMGDAANLWSSEGELLYRNRASERLHYGLFDTPAVTQLTFHGRRYERRAAECASRGRRYLLEILREV